MVAVYFDDFDNEIHAAYDRSGDFDDADESVELDPINQGGDIAVTFNADGRAFVARGASQASDRKIYLDPTP